MTILDASSLINVVNSGVSTELLRLTSHQFVIGPQALAECAAQHHLIECHVGHEIVLLADDAISASAFFSFLEKYGLGLGETECLTLAVQYQARVCSDHRRARQMCTRVLGKERVLGSVRLLREAVTEKLLSPGEALNAYCGMRSSGAFLPRIPDEYWSEDG